MTHADPQIASPAATMPVACKVNDFSKLIGLSRTSLYAMMQRGELKSVVVAGRRLIPYGEALRLIEEAA